MSTRARSNHHDIVGESSALREVLRLVDLVAETDATTLITGETGTGKELVARAIHESSRRRGGPLVCVNCAALPATLVASELFGHERGAFTGALQRKLGRFELAQGGTIFLDEIGELPHDTQVALLRVTQERVIDRVGGGRAVPIDVRIISATNRDLEEAVARGAFRADLLYRLNVVPLVVPALRDRREDIPLLVEHFLERYARSCGKAIERISDDTLELLRSYDWPGNVRELQNIVERAVVLAQGGVLSVDPRWLARLPAATEPSERPLTAQLTFQERCMIEGALSATLGRVSGPHGAAARLRLPASTLESKIRSLGIDKNRFKMPAPAVEWV